MEKGKPSSLKNACLASLFDEHFSCMHYMLPTPFDFGRCLLTDKFWVVLMSCSIQEHLVQLTVATCSVTIFHTSLLSHQHVYLQTHESTHMYTRLHLKALISTAKRHLCHLSAVIRVLACVVLFWRICKLHFCKWRSE